MRQGGGDQVAAEMARKITTHCYKVLTSGGRSQYIMPYLPDIILVVVREIIESNDKCLIGNMFFSQLIDTFREKNIYFNTAFRNDYMLEKPLVHRG